MKKFLLGILLPVLTLVTLIGTGFATWYFNENLSVTQSTTTNVHVTAIAKVGTIELTNADAKLQLDSTKPGQNGIRLLDAATGNSPVTLTGTYKAHDPGVSTETQDAGSVTFTVTVTFTTEQAKYVGIKTGLNDTDWKTTDNKVYTKSITTDGKTSNTIDITSADFKYISEPSKIDEYTAMKNAFQSTVQIDFSATHTPKAA